MTQTAYKEKQLPIKTRSDYDKHKTLARTKILKRNMGTEETLNTEQAIKEYDAKPTW